MIHHERKVMDSNTFLIEIFCNDTLIVSRFKKLDLRYVIRLAFQEVSENPLRRNGLGSSETKPDQFEYFF